MAVKVGNRVTVLPGVSPRTDPGSITFSTPNGISRDNLVGKRGEVVEVDGERVLVDGQLVNGERRGPMEFREWFLESELEVG